MKSQFRSVISTIFQITVAICNSPTWGWHQPMGTGDPGHGGPWFPWALPLQGKFHPIHPKCFWKSWILFLLLRWITGTFEVEIRLYQSGEDIFFSVCFWRRKEFHVFLCVSMLQVLFRSWWWFGLSIGTENPRGTTFFLRQILTVYSLVFYWCTVVTQRSNQSCINWFYIIKLILVVTWLVCRHTWLLYPVSCG